MTVVPGNYERSLSMDIQTANVIMHCAKVLRYWSHMDLVMVLEALSDNPDLFLTSFRPGLYDMQSGKQPVL